ncbi:ribosomal protein L24, bacterial/organelle [Thiovulum sp. ES]|jgi:large subunit ribosomal protein L24|nr:ribosomal protein L24, bacterial/organelle [Thiovulum sp. ES]
MKNKLKIKKGDKVLVIAGDDKGKTGTVLRAIPRTRQLIVEGVKVVKKAVKPTEQNKEGGFDHKEMPIDISNVKKVEE